MRGVLVIALAACRGSPPPLYPAGSAQDDGYGDLAQKSASLVTRTDDGPPWAPHHHRGPDAGPAYSLADGDDDTHSDLTPPRPYTTLDHDLSAVVEGTITWRGPRPAPIATACGPMPPGVRVAASGAAGGVLIYIERVEAGRHRTHGDRAGGVLVKRGCALAPALQIVTPLPRALVIHGDATPTALQITHPQAPTVLADLQPAGRLEVATHRNGITTIQAPDGSLVPAWVVASDAPYYALTGDDGRYRIDELAPGDYNMMIVAGVPDGDPRLGKPLIAHRHIVLGPDRPLRVDIALAP